MVKSEIDLKEKALGMVAFFETSNGYPECYGITASNWDGAGLSHGVLQYNFKSGTLQPLWNHMNTNYNQLCRDIFGTDYTTWSNLINASLSEQQAFGTANVDPNNSRLLKQPWKDYFMTLGTSQPSIERQIEMSASWHNSAMIWFKRLGLTSRRGYALLFSISVQMGRLLCQNAIWNDFKNINTTGKTQAQIEEEKLWIIVNRVSGGDNRVFNSTTIPDLTGIVYRRHSAIVSGSNTVGFNIANYDLRMDEPALKGVIRSG